MDKPQLNYNEYLRYIFAGGFGMLCYFFLQPAVYRGIFNKDGDFKDSLFLVLVAMILGSFLYAVHRAALYPICLRINCIFLTLAKKFTINAELNWWNILTGQKLFIQEDFRRWNQRDNPKSFAKHLLDWSAQIHFLYCCVWAMIAAKVFAFQKVDTTNCLVNSWYYIAAGLFLISLRNHYRSLLYDLSISKKDSTLKNQDAKSSKKIDIKIETEE